ncbi:MAG TPA: hypothetical protein VEA69_25410 [Tepidisphaeraceae bacterium]|nr:hypothetical protein [Tepidisphaeraceae bacterium]
MRVATDVRFVDMSRGGDGNTVLHFEAPRFGEVAGEVYEQGLLFGSLPEPQDTAFDLMGDVVNDVALKVRDSEKYDVGILQRLERFKRPIFGHGVDELRLLGGRLPAANPRKIDLCVTAAATSLYQQTPAPVRSRLAGRLDMIRASDKVFSLILKDGRQVRGIWLGDSIQPLREHVDQDVVVNGVVNFRPSGAVLRIDAEAVDAAGPADSFFSKLPAVTARLGRRQILQPQTSSAGMRAVFGKWPGEESDEEVLQALEDIE